MKPTTLLFLTLATSLSAATACHANLYVPKITQQVFVTDQPKAIYETNPGQTANVTISSRCSYECKNVSGSTRTVAVSWQPQLSLIRKPNSLIIGFYSETRHASAIVMNGDSWRKSNDVLAFTIAAPIDLYDANALTYLSEDKTGEDTDLPIITTQVTVRQYA